MKTLHNHLNYVLGLVTSLANEIRLTIESGEMNRVTQVQASRMREAADTAKVLTQAMEEIQADRQNDTIRLSACDMSGSDYLVYVVAPSGKIITLYVPNCLDEEDYRDTIGCGLNLTGEHHITGV